MVVSEHCDLDILEKKKRKTFTKSYVNLYVNSKSFYAKKNSIILIAITEPSDIV